MNMTYYIRVKDADFLTYNTLYIDTYSAKWFSADDNKTEEALRHEKTGSGLTCYRSLLTFNGYVKDNKNI